MTEAAATEVLRRAQAHPRQRPFWDPLSRTHLRRVFEDALRALPPGSRPILLVVDINDLRGLNVLGGCPLGDKILSVTAKRLKALVGRRGLVARIGGDEFAVLFLGTASDAVDVGAQLRAALAAYPFESEGSRFQVTASVGVTICEAREDAQARVDRTWATVDVIAHAPPDQLILY